MGVSISVATLCEIYHNFNNQRNHANNREQTSGTSTTAVGLMAFSGCHFELRHGRYVMSTKSAPAKSTVMSARSMHRQILLSLLIPLYDLASPETATAGTFFLHHNSNSPEIFICIFQPSSTECLHQCIETS